MRKFLYGNKRGFTIIEVLVIVVVISILVSVVVVGYGNYQANNRDSERKSDLQQIAAALKSYATWKNDFIEVGSGCGSSNNGEGFIAASSADAGAPYAANSIATCLVNAGYLKSVTEGTDPSGCTYGSGGACGSQATPPVRAYMKVTCTPAGKPKTTYLLAYLETQAANNAVIDPICSKSWGTTYGMNYYITVQ